MGHQPGELQPRRIDDRLCQLDRRSARLHSIQIQPRIDIHRDVQADAAGRRGRGQIRGVGQAVDRNADPHLPRQGAKPHDLLRRHDQVRHE